MYSQFSNRLVSLAVLACASGMGSVFAQAAVITNGDFETGDLTGDLTGWTLTNASAFDAVCASGSVIGSSTCIANSGTYSMAFGQFEGLTTLSQTIATTSGSTYTISFYLANDNPGGSVESFAMQWNGSTVFSLPDPQASFPYSQRVILNLTATSSSTLLAFDARHDPAQWFLDSIAIADSAVPEPASLLLTGVGLAAILQASRRLRRRQLS